MAKLKLAKHDPLLTALRDWMQLRGVRRKVLAMAWGVKPSAVSKRLNGRVALESAELLDLIQRLGLDPEELFRGIRAGFHAELFLARIAKEDKDQVKNLVRHHLRRPPARAYAPDELRDMAASLEELRFRDRDAARARALEILRCPDLDPDVAGEAWGVLGVLHRYEGRISCAAYCYGHALRVGGSDPLRARTWQRLAMLLLFNVGDTDLALRVTRWAREIYSNCGDTVGIGKTLVDEGVIYASSGVFERSIAVYESALELLGDRSPEHRFGAFQGTAVAYANLGNIRRANDFLDQAAAAWSGQKSSKMYASLLFLKGEIALLLDQLAQASQYFLRARNRCLELGLALEYVLVSLRIAKVYFLQGDRGRLSRVLKEILFQQREVERSNKVLGRTLGEFLAESAREHVSAEILDEIYSKLREGAQVAPPLFSPKNSP